MDTRPSLVKLFIEAPTKEELVILQVRNNILHGKRFIYDTPMKDGDMWVAWYFGDVDQAMILQEALDVLKEGDK